MSFENKIFSTMKKGEKNLFLISLILILISLYLILSGYGWQGSSSKVYVGYKEIDLDSMQLTDLQEKTCTIASEQNSCFKIDETFIITSNICCKKMEVCCGG